jgi:hypothetical protein
MEIHRVRPRFNCSNLAVFYATLSHKDKYIHKKGQFEYIMALPINGA